MTPISGNTYPVKDALKALGGKWDAATKAWLVPDAVADQARALVSAAPVAPRKGTGSGGPRQRKAGGGGIAGTGRYRCRECGRMNRYDNGGHCGEPCDDGD